MARFSEEARDDGVCVVRTSGDLDLAAVEEFIEVGRAVMSRCAAIELDLGDVTFIDSSGLGALVRLRKEAEAGNVPMHLTRVSESTSRLLELTGLTGVFDISASQS